MKTHFYVHLETNHLEDGKSFTTYLNMPLDFRNSSKWNVAIEEFSFTASLYNIKTNFTFTISTPTFDKNDPEKILYDSVTINISQLEQHGIFHDPLSLVQDINEVARDLIDPEIFSLDFNVENGYFYINCKGCSIYSTDQTSCDLIGLIKNVATPENLVIESQKREKVRLPLCPKIYMPQQISVRTNIIDIHYNNANNILKQWDYFSNRKNELNSSPRNGDENYYTSTYWSPDIHNLEFHKIKEQLIKDITITIVNEKGEPLKIDNISDKNIFITLLFKKGA